MVAIAGVVAIGPAVAVRSVAQPAPTPGRTTATPQATVEIISASARPVAGKTLWLGLRFRLAEGWHIYWVNPGDSGGPPTLAWNLPEGFEAGAFVWPTPHRLPFGSLVNYGYEGDVILPVAVTVPKSWRGGPITLGGRARWLACKELCVSQQGQLAITLPLAEADAASIADWAGKIRAARAAEPAPAPRAWRARVRSARDTFTLTVELDRAAEPAYFFPLDESQVNDSAQQGVRVSGRGLEITLRKSDQLTEDPPRLRGVLKFSSGTAYIVEAPVSASS